MQARKSAVGTYTASVRSETERARLLLQNIAARRGADFSGVGVIVYDDLAGLPHLQLLSGHESPDVSRYEGDIAESLVAISTMTGPLHDGFHFVEAAAWRLTHLSQFISPPIPGDAGGRFHGTGARLMAAALASLIPGITCVGLVAQGGEIHLFCRGSDVAQEN